MKEHLKATKISDRVYWVGAVDWDRRMFDDLIPLPDGTSYNAYLIQGSEKTVLIDTVDPEMSQVLFDRLNQLGTKHIDYLLVQMTHRGRIS